MPKSAKQLLKENDQGKSGRKNIESHWQTLHDFFDIAGTDVNRTYYAGTELTVSELYDGYSLDTANTLAAGLMNYLTPAASKWFAFKTKDPVMMQSKRVAKYLKEVEEEVIHSLNRSNYYDVAPSFYKKSGVYGTSILFQEEDPFDDIRFYSIPIKNCVINDDARGRVVEYWVEFEYTATQAVTRFGLDKVHETVRKEHLEGRNPDKKYTYTLYIGPNWDRNPMAIDSGNKKYIAQWLDNKHQIEVERGGFDELPALTHRFYRRDEMVWGASPAMMALYEVRMLNAKAKTQLRAEMKLTDPAIALPSDAFLMPLNMNPRGVNVYNKQAMAPDDIFPIGNYGNPGIGKESMEYSKEAIRSHMFTEVFLAFANVQKQMNNPEVFERIAEKMTLLGPSVGRFLNLNDDVLKRTVGILARKGKLPEKPPELMEDPRYEIEYLSTLARAQRNGDLQSLQNAMALVGQMAQFDPQVLDKINVDESVDEIFGITGASVRMLRDDEEVENIRANRAEAQAAEQQAALLGAGAGIARDATQASLNAAHAQAVT